MEKKPGCLFELSWEVCNKVGGIHTVLESKASLLVERMNHYFLIGPYIKDKAKINFEEQEAPVEFREVFSNLEREGLKLYFGTWLIKGEPNCILIDTNNFRPRLNEIKKRLWDEYGIDSLNTGSDFDDPVLWSWAAGMLVNLLSSDTQHANCNMIAHAHEWLAGPALLYLKTNKSRAKTVFTTHATSLGRALASSGYPIYEKLNEINPNEEAKSHNVGAKHLTEVACARYTDVFTTVSETTAMEAEQFLGRKAEFLLLNGLDIANFPTMEEASVLHRKHRTTIRNFISYFFLPYYYIEVEQTLTFFIMARYEPHNKGIDIFIEALARLNDHLKEENYHKTVIAFFWVPRDVLETRTDVALSKLSYDSIQHFIDGNSDEFQNRLLDNVMRCSDTKCYASGSDIERGSILNDEELKVLKKLRLSFSKQGDPPLCTHNLPDEQNDRIIRKLLDLGLDNKDDDKVKAVFYPVYLTGVDGLLDLTYYDAIMGSHLGVFPSYYEPWGYTPMESAAVGVPSITTDLAGCGRFLKKEIISDDGIYVLERFNKDPAEVVETLTTKLYDYVHLKQQQRVQQKIAAKKVAALADWSVLIENYIKAYDLAIGDD